MNEILKIILDSAADSFIQVTVFVAAALLFFGYIDYKNKGGFIRLIEKSKKFQPLLGALLGVIPGCGGAIFVMPLYTKGVVSFGTVIATLIATAGDSAFITLTKTPFVFLVITLICFFVAVLSGYAIDYLKVGKRMQTRILKENQEQKKKKHEEIENEIDDKYKNKTSKILFSRELFHVGHKEGDEVDLVLHHQKEINQNNLGYRITHTLFWIFWIFSGIGLTLGIFALAMVDIDTLIIPNLGWIVGVLGTFVCVFFTFLSKKFFQNESHESEEHKIYSLKETFIHTAADTAFVGLWVFVAYFIYELVVHFLGGEAVVSAWLLSSGLMSVFMGAVVGLIPGCGPQVIFVTLYIKGAFPFAALLSNAISQDGDALFPLFALHKKSAVYASLITTVPALIVGFLVYFFEKNWLI